MAATNASKAKATKAQTGYEKLMAGATKSEFTATVDKASEAIAAEVSKPKVVEPIVERATPVTRPLVAPVQSGISAGTVNIHNLKTGRTVQMDGVVAEKMARRYPNEFKIVE